MKNIVLAIACVLIACIPVYSQEYDQYKVINDNVDKFTTVRKDKVQIDSLFVRNINDIMLKEPTLYKVVSINEKTIEYIRVPSATGMLLWTYYKIQLIDSIEYMSFERDLKYITLDEHKKLHSEYMEIRKKVTEKNEKNFKTKLNELTKKYGATNAKRIMQGKIWLGMTKDMCIESWGHPDDINRSVGSWGIHEQWIYGDDVSNRTYVYFENGKLTSWQD